MQPAPILFDGNAECDEPVSAPLPIHSSVEYDRDSFYASVYADGSRTEKGALTMALRLVTPAGSQRYVYLPLPFPIPWGGWPIALHVDVTGAMLEDLNALPATWLVCGHLLLTGAK